MAKGLKQNGLIVLNTPKPVTAYDFGGARVAVADVSALSVEAGLPPGRINSGIIGVLCRAFEIVPFESVLEEIANEFVGKKPEANAEAARLCYENTTVREATAAGVA